ncbi:hypothetical protein BD311DRAFT_678915, partial [Dichomitus squalens]
MPSAVAFDSSRRPPARVSVLPAESGRPETAKEFSKRIKRVVLRVPDGGQQEGEGLADSSDVDNSIDPVILPEEYKPAPPSREQETHFISYLSHNTEGLDLLSSLKDRYSEDKFFGPILENPKQFKNFLYNDGLVFIRDNQKTLLCVPDVRIDSRSAREIVIRHAHSLLAHLGIYRTLTLLRDHLWWKT